MERNVNYEKYMDLFVSAISSVPATCSDAAVDELKDLTELAKNIDRQVCVC